MRTVNCSKYSMFFFNDVANFIVHCLTCVITLVYNFQLKSQVYVYSILYGFLEQVNITAEIFHFS